MTLYKWSQTAAADATADSTVNWAEGQAPSSVNDSARAMMAATAKYRDDIAGAIVTGGTATAYTVTSYQVFDTLAHLSGQMIAFTPHATNTGSSGCTLNVDGLGAKALRSSPNVELPSGSIILGTPYVVTYNNSDACFYLQGGAANAYSIPLGAGMDFWGSTAPNSAFAFPAGQAISRTTYSTLFGLLSTTYGTGDGSTTFNLPDLRGRVVAALDNMGGSAVSRLTSLTATPDGQTLGAAAGGQVVTLVTANLPPYTPAGSVATTVTPSGAVPHAGVANSVTPPGSVAFSAYDSTNVTFSGSSTFTGTAQGGTSTPMNNMPPTILCNYIIRVI